jgi:ABC-type uncharacterized transport system permease subunit
MADERAGSAGIGLGGILVIAGIVIAIIWSVWIGIIVALVGLVAFGGFAKEQSNTLLRSNTLLSLR